MNLGFKKTTCRVLVISLFALSFQTARAGLIGADQAAAAQTAPTERAMVLSTMDRADVQSQLQAAGVDPLAARERVQNMTDQEIHAMAQDMQSAPAAGTNGWAWAAVIAIIALIWYFAVRK